MALLKEGSHKSTVVDKVLKIYRIINKMHHFIDSLSISVFVRYTLKVTFDIEKGIHIGRHNFFCHLAP